ncbi:uncharacterized protein LOC132313409 [Cornus florida]|uniref:uncharacterized protein LOC132313409 n=1 Tax=Cornus florida TaxID=4283 RepID=UPI00289F10C4|nr:uncharacterized protein LOC132313409 [Cornus florida]
MGRNKFLTAIFFLFLIFSDCSDASLAWNFRKLVGLAPKDNNSTTTPGSPLPSPDSGSKELNSSAVDADMSGQSPNSSPKINPKGSNNGNNSSNDDNNSTSSANPPTKKKIDEGQIDKGKEKIDEKTNSQLDTDGGCESSPKKCRIEKTIVACIQGFEGGSKDIVLVVHNEGESTLEVNITIPTPMENSLGKHIILKSHTERINISLAIGQSTNIVLHAGNAECVIDMGPSVAEGNFFQRLPSYYKQVTPIYGAYFLFLIALIVGGTWACCKFGKRRRQAGVPYQELEMGLPESASAVHVDSVEGWDQGWDDDWDEERAVKSPGGRHVGNISANGLTSRSSNRDGWENDWDD